MALEFRQTQKQTQKLLLTPQMQQSLRILQLTAQELKIMINQELENNPLLEEIEADHPPGGEKDLQETPSPEVQQIINEDETWWEYTTQKGHNEKDEEGRTYRESLITKPLPFQNDFTQQLALNFQDGENRQVGEFILGNLDESGYLETSPAEIAEALGVTPEAVEKVLKTIQHFEPPGIAARDLRESLLIQLEHSGEKETVAHRIIDRFLPDLGKKRYGPIAKALGVSVQTVKEAHKRIGQLEPRPGRGVVSGTETGYLTPDLLVTKKDEHYELTFVNEGFPSIRINPLYKELLKGKNENPSKKTKEFLKEKLKEALTLIRCLNQRRETTAKVLRIVIEFQKEFLEKGLECLKPLTLKDVAGLLGCHESTVSRVVMNKVVETPHGCFPLKFFFNRPTKTTEEGEPSLASKSVMAVIEGWIQQEDGKHPMSDQEIVERLKKENLTVARRTVAKYRQALKILPSYLRKK